MTYKYKGRGMVQLTGNKMGINTIPIPSMSISSAINNSLQWTNSSPSITITSSGSQAGYTAQGLFEDMFASKHEPHYKKYEVYDFQEDVLAISCAWKRYRDNNPSEPFRYSKLTDKALFDIVNVDDRNLAKEIRDYYSKKIMMLNLKGQRLTRFRKALNSYIHGDTHKVIEELFPVIFRLPEFYEYDMCLEDIKLSLENRARGAELEKYHGKLFDFELLPIKNVKKVNKRSKVTQYWLNGKDDTPVLIELEPKNPLLHIWNDIFNSKKVLQIRGMAFVRGIDDFEYLSIKDWKLTKI